jgi:transcriptional regulator with XRE-family HTH domain
VRAGRSRSQELKRLQIGELLYRLRTTQAVSQNALAKALGLSPSYLSLLERGKRPASVQVVRRMAKWLGIAPGLILLETMEPDALETRPRALVEDVQKEFEKALSSGDFEALQRRLLK